MPRYHRNLAEDLNAEIRKAHADVEDLMSFDPKFHETQAARILAYKYSSESSYTKAAAHAALATSLRLKAKE